VVILGFFGLSVQEYDLINANDFVIGRALEEL
jgi:hypothetical protein